MSPTLRLRDPVRASVWTAAGLTLVGIGATAAYPHPWLAPEATIAVTVTSFALATLCFIRAFRYWYIGGSPLGSAVSYPQFMKTREQLRKEIGERDLRIANLNAELATLREALQKTKQDATPREIDPLRKVSFAYWAKDHVADLKQKAIHIFTVPTAFDSTVLAGHICDLLKGAGVTAVHLRQLSTFVEVLDPLQSFGI